MFPKDPTIELIEKVALMSNILGFYLPDWEKKKSEITKSNFGKVGKICRVLLTHKLPHWGLYCAVCVQL